jgi:hypothetical protein
MNDFNQSVSLLVKAMAGILLKSNIKKPFGVDVFKVDLATFFPYLFKQHVLTVYVSDQYFEHYDNNLEELNYFVLNCIERFDVNPDLVLCVLDKVQSWPKQDNIFGVSSYLAEHPKIPFRKLASRTEDACKKAIAEHLIKEASIEDINPYSINKHTPLNMLFGRRYDLERLSSDRDHRFIFGPRRIGKSSLVAAFVNQLGKFPIGKNKAFDRSEALLSLASYVDVSKVLKEKGYEERLWEQILRGFGITSKQLESGSRVRKLITQTREERRTPVYDPFIILERLTMKYRRELTIILDEVDGLIEKEVANGWSFMERLRAISEDGNVRIFLVGYESLWLATLDDRFPLYERGKPHRVQPIDRKSVQELMRGPLENLGAGFDDIRALENRIWETSTGMPHVVQDICRIVFEIYLRSVRQARQKDRDKVRISMTDVEAAIDNSKAVMDLRRGDIVKGFPLAEAVAGITSLGVYEEGESAGRNVTLPQIINQLEDIGFIYIKPELDLALAYLRVRGILMPHDSEETVWSWINSVAKKGLCGYIEKIGYKRWSDEILRRHNEKGWRNRYKQFNQIYT